jgi:hypothetical protein
VVVRNGDEEVAVEKHGERRGGFVEQGGIVAGGRRRVASIFGYNLALVFIYFSSKKWGCHFNLLYKIQFGTFETLKN